MYTKFWLVNLEGRNDLILLGVRRDNNIKTNVREMGYEGGRLDLRDSAKGGMLLLF
jgi:hypothetical protein